MEKSIDFAKAKEEMDVYINGLINIAKGIVDQNPHLLQAFGDFMNVNHKEIDPLLEKTWDHNAMWLLHHQFMQKADALKSHSPAYAKEIDELTTIMKLIAQVVDLALLPKDKRGIVEEWANRYKAYFGKTK